MGCVQLWQVRQGSNLGLAKYGFVRPSEKDGGVENFDALLKEPRLLRAAGTLPRSSVGVIQPQYDHTFLKLRAVVRTGRFALSRLQNERCNLIA